MRKDIITFLHYNFKQKVLYDFSRKSEKRNAYIKGLHMRSASVKNERRDQTKCLEVFFDKNF